MCLGDNTCKVNKNQKFIKQWNYLLKQVFPVLTKSSHTLVLWEDTLTVCCSPFSFHVTLSDQVGGAKPYIPAPALLLPVLAPSVFISPENRCLNTLCYATKAWWGQCRGDMQARSGRPEGEEGGPATARRWRHVVEEVGLLLCLCELENNTMNCVWSLICPPEGPVPETLLYDSVTLCCPLVGLCFFVSWWVVLCFHLLASEILNCRLIPGPLRFTPHTTKCTIIQPLILHSYCKCQIIFL